MNLTWANIDRIIKDALLDDARDTAILQDILDKGLNANVEELKAHAAALGIVVVETAMQHMAFNKERLESHRAEVAAMIVDLAPQFLTTGGGGWSMLNLPFDKNGTQWGEQWHADMFYGIAAGLGLAHFALPRDMWSVMPGGLPYITFVG